MTEFGDVGIDEKILSENCNEEVVEVMNGCICCTVRGDLVEALKNLYTKIEQFDAVIIETTGLADPAPVAQTFFVDEDIRKNYSLDGIVTWPCDEINYIWRYKNKTFPSDQITVDKVTPEIKKYINNIKSRRFRTEAVSVWALPC